MEGFSLISIFPKDIWRKILFLLDSYQMFTTSRVCGYFYHISLDETYWKQQLEKDPVQFNCLRYISLNYRTRFVYYVLNNPIRLLITPNISPELVKGCQDMIISILSNEDHRFTHKHCIWIWINSNTIHIYTKRNKYHLASYIFGLKMIMYDNLHPTKPILNTPKYETIKLLHDYGWKKLK